MSYREMARRLAELEQQQAGPQKIIIVDVTHDEHDRELTPQEVKARLAAARADVGPDGLVVHWGYYDMSTEEAAEL